MNVTTVEKEVKTIPLKKKSIVSELVPIRKRHVRPKVLTIRDILTKALGFIKVRWMKGNLQSPGGAVCSVGAVYKAASKTGRLEDGHRTPEAERAIKLLGKHVPKTHRNVIYFNDSTATKKADVIAVFKAAIKDPASNKPA
jgi:hypothetical protein